ncbi:MAG: hypothetical protein ACU85E_16130 [Gammaproteobacteria bacterium]
MFRFYAPKKRTFFICLILGCLATSFIGSTGRAETAPLGEQAASSLDALKKANQYSFDTGGIGVLIRYGSGNAVTADEIGSAFVNEIRRRGVEARYFYALAQWEGVTIEYHIGYSALGPWNSSEAASNVSKAVARAKAAQEVHNQ